MASDVRVWTGAAWESLKGQQGPPGPKSISADAGNELTLGADGLPFYKASAGGTLPDSDSYIWCKPGDNIISKYGAAKALKPSGQVLASNNRATLIVLPGSYSSSVALRLDAEFVDIYGVGFARLDRGCRPAVWLIREGGLGDAIIATANDIRVAGVGTLGSGLRIGNNLTSQCWDCCLCDGGMSNPFGAPCNALAGTFINCESRNDKSSNDAFQQPSGRFVNCLVKGGGGFGCGGTGIASGVFINCEVVGGQGFGCGDAAGIGGSGTASGTFIDCIAGNDSFGCTGGSTSVVALRGLASGIFERCQAGARSFGCAKKTGDIGTASGTFTDCAGGNHSFGGNTVAADGDRECSGTFLNCTGGANSFGRDTGTGITATARLVNCRKTTGTFGTPQVGAVLRWCLENWTTKANVG